MPQINIPIPKNIADMMTFLVHEIAHLSVIFSTYTRLYGNDDNLKLLWDSDDAFFHDLQIIYLNYISVAVSRLLDPEKTGDKTNLTMFTLIAALKSTGHTEEADKLHKRLLNTKEKAYNFIDPRNQLVSHFDYKANSIDPHSKAIPSFTKAEFDEFCDDIGKLMNEIYDIFGMPPCVHWGIVGHRCGEKLINRLKRASEFSIATVSGAR